MAQVIDPMCGMLLDPTSAAATSSYGGQTYYFCSIGCQLVFDANPAEHATHPPAHTTLVRDPVCGMMVEPALALHVHHQGQRYSFCSHGCTIVFQANPATYLPQQQAAGTASRALEPGREQAYTDRDHKLVERR